MSGLSNEQLSRRLKPARWSIAECIKHLNLTGGLVQHIAKKAIASARSEGLKGNGPYCQLSGGIMWMMAHQRRHLWQAEKVRSEIVTAVSGEKAASA